MTSALVVFFSRSGTTRRVANDIASRLACPIAEITEPKPRRGAIAYMRSAFEALAGSWPEIGKFPHNLREFPLIVVGTPVWAGHLASPVRSLLALRRHELKTLSAFCTMGGLDPGKTFEDIRLVSGKNLAATLAMSERELASSEYAAKLDTFIAALRGLQQGG
jgi:flavodoxin